MRVDPNLGKAANFAGIPKAPNPIACTERYRAKLFLGFLLGLVLLIPLATQSSAGHKPECDGIFWNGGTHFHTTGVPGNHCIGDDHPGGHPEYFSTGSGDDQINARDNTGIGTDELHGQNDADELYGENGWDEIWAEEGNDLAFGGPGNDDIHMDNGEDLAYGDGGQDDMWGGRQQHL